MNYTDSDAVSTRLKNIAGNGGSLDIDRMNEALQTADDLINSQLDESDVPHPATAPDILKRAATFYAAADLLDISSNLSENRNPVAKTWDDKGDKLTQNYITQYENNNNNPDSPDSYHYGLSDNKRPFKGYMRTMPRKRWY